MTITVLQIHIDWKSLFSREKESRLCAKCVFLQTYLYEVMCIGMWRRLIHKTISKVGMGDSCRSIQCLVGITNHYFLNYCDCQWLGMRKMGENLEMDPTLYSPAPQAMYCNMGLPQSKEKVSLPNLLKDIWWVIGSPASLCPDFSTELINHWSAWKHWRKHRMTNFFHMTPHVWDHMVDF